MSLLSLGGDGSLFMMASSPTDSTGETIEFSNIVNNRQTANIICFIVLIYWHVCGRR